MESAIEQVAGEVMAEAAAKAAAKAAMFELPPPKELEGMQLRQNRYAYANKVMYRVYASPGHFELVEAGSAHEAFAKAGLPEAMKIQREAFFTQIAIDRELLESSEEPLALAPDLPEPEEIAAKFIDAATVDAELAARQTVFEPLSLGELSEVEAPDEPELVAEDVAPEAEAVEPVAASESEPVVAPDPMPDLAAEPEVHAEPVVPQDATPEVIPEPVPTPEETQEAAPATEPTPETPDKPLSPDEVNALLSDGDED